MTTRALHHLPLAGLAAVLALACGAPKVPSSGPAKVDIPYADTTKGPKKKDGGPARVLPPASGDAKDSPFPAVESSALPSGLTVDVVTAKQLPLVQVRFVVRVGSGYGPGAAAELTAEMLKDGGTRTMTSADVSRRIETLGADLGVRVDLDATVVTLTVPSDKLAEAFAIAAEVVREPRFDEGELTKLKARMSDEAEENRHSNGRFMAMRVLFQELFPAGPYSRVGLLPSEIAKTTGKDLRDLHAKWYVPKNVGVVFAGDVDAKAANALVDKAFGKWKGGPAAAAPAIEFPAPKEIDKRRVIVAHRAKSAQSDVFVVMLAPERKTPAWPAIRVANQVLGGGVASRLFIDVREKRSLAYGTGSSIMELAHGRQPLTAYAGTQTAKTDQAVAGILENLQKIASGDVSEAETSSARRYLSDIFAVRMETVGSVADLVSLTRVLGLPSGYFDAYRAEVRATEAAKVNETAKALYSDTRAIVVVAGDATAIAEPLRRFGEVTIVDPEKDFAVQKTLPAAP